MATILVVDDELGIRALLSDILTDEGHTVELAENASQARSQRERCDPDLVLLDIWMPDVDGITLLKEWGANGQLTMPVIMMSGHGTIDTAVEATKVGAQAFLEKPITMQKLLRAVEQGLAKAAPMPAHAAAAPGARQGAGGGLSLGIGSPGVGSGLGMGSGAGLAMGGTAAGSAHHVASVTAISSAPSYHAGSALGSHRHELGSAGNGLGVGMGGGMGMGMGHSLASPIGLSPASPSLLSHEQVFELDRPLREARDDFERAYFEFHLAREGGSMTRVAEKTGLERTHLYRKLKQLGVDLTRNRKSAMN